MSMRSFTSGLFVVGIAAVGLAPVAVLAEDSSSAAQDARFAGSAVEHFELSRHSAPEVLRYQSPHEVRVCNRTERHPFDLDSSSPPWKLLKESPPLRRSSSPVALAVTYDGATRRLDPGQCYLGRARSVQIGSAEPLSSANALDGSVHESVPSELMRDEFAYAGLARELQRVDDAAREGTAELNRARQGLLKTTNALDRTQRLEARVQRDENAARRAESAVLSAGRAATG